MSYRLEVHPRGFDLRSTEDTDGGRPVWLLETEISWEFWDDDLCLVKDICPKGMKTDLGSIPRFLSSIVNGNDKWNLAYILHDRWCQQKWLNSELAADLLQVACREFGCPPWDATAIHSAVKNFGPQWAGNPPCQGDLQCL